jgi:hypothetical protein
MNYTDTQLKQALAKMLPAKVYMNTNGGQMYHRLDGKPQPKVLDTELLHLCWLVEETLNKKEKRDVQEELVNEETPYEDLFWDICHATWQQRTIALAKVKGIEI